MAVIGRSLVTSAKPVQPGGSTVAKPSKDLFQTEVTLLTVIETLIDAQDGFQKIGEAMEEQTLKDYFLIESLKRAEFRGELENILHQEGMHDIHESGTAVGAIRQAWAGLGR